jgi:hypothetical protein
MAAAGLILGFFAESIEYLFFTHGLLTGIICVSHLISYFKTQIFGSDEQVYYKLY